MLLSLALILLCGMLFGGIFQRLRLPSLLGMILAGILLGPYMLNMLEHRILEISADLRQLALIIILMRAGISLNIDELRNVGRPAILICFLPACFEIVGMMLLAPLLLGVTLLDAAIMGAVVAAVSPAVIVPRILKLMEGNYGTKKAIPQMIMAGASADDIFVIILFTSFTRLAQGGSITLIPLLRIPISIILGLCCGGIVGIVLSLLFKYFHLRDTIKLVIILSVSLLLVTLENILGEVVGFSGLLAVMALGAMLQRKTPKVSQRISLKLSKLWIVAEIILFVLVGATVNIQYALKAGAEAVLLIFCVMLFRIIGVFTCLIKTNLNKNQRIFVALAYMPKATVQAAIGGLPLAMGLMCGDIVLTVAVLSILITAPLGAVLIDKTYKRLLK